MNWNEYFTYGDGRLYWKVTNSNREQIGSIAGFYDKEGYRLVGLKGKDYKMHRIIYEMLVGPIPEGLHVDHINSVKDDNRIENLRLATNQENQRNRGFNKNNKLGVKGVTFNKQNQKYQARIGIKGANKHLGYFNTPEEASQAYQEAAKQHFGEFAPTS